MWKGGDLGAQLSSGTKPSLASMLGLLLTALAYFLPVNKSKCHTVIVFARHKKMLVSHYWILLEQLSFNQPIQTPLLDRSPSLPE